MPAGSSGPQNASSFSGPSTSRKPARPRSSRERKGIVIDEDGRLIVASLDTLREIEENGSL